MKTEIFSPVWTTFHKYPVKIVSENASFYKCYLQSEDFWQRRFPVFYVAVVQWRQRNFVQKSVLHVQTVVVLQR